MERLKGEMLHRNHTRTRHNKPVIWTRSVHTFTWVSYTIQRKGCTFANLEKEDREEELYLRSQQRREEMEVAN
jgi:hypothetical protein